MSTDYTIVNNANQITLSLNEQSHITLEKGCGLLKKLDVFFWLGAGTALGLYRDKDFIKNDTDIDIETYEVSTLKKQEIIKEFTTNGFTPYRIVTDGQDEIQTAFLDKETNTLFDIEYYKPTNWGTIKYWSEGLGHVEFPLYFVHLVEPIDYKNNSYPIIHPETYLEYVYGKTWKNPINKKDTTFSYGKDE